MNLIKRLTAILIVASLLFLTACLSSVKDTLKDEPENTLKATLEPAPTSTQQQLEKPTKHDYFFDASNYATVLVYMSGVDKCGAIALHFDGSSVEEENWYALSAMVCAALIEDKIDSFWIVGDCSDGAHLDVTFEWSDVSNKLEIKSNALLTSVPDSLLEIANSNWMNDYSQATKVYNYAQGLHDCVDWGADL